MLTKALLALLAAVGVSSSPTSEPPDDVEPPDIAEDQHFCCKSVSTDKDVKVGFGDGCAIAEKIHIGTCAAVLYCPGGYTFEGGVVTCPL